MKIRSVIADADRQRFDVRTQKGRFPFPYAKADPPPGPDDPVIQVAPDPELGNEGFTYTLSSGAEGSLHLDSVREEARDPIYLEELESYRRQKQGTTATADMVPVTSDTVLIAPEARADPTAGPVPD